MSWQTGDSQDIFTEYMLLQREDSQADSQNASLMNNLLGKGEKENKREEHIRQTIKN